MTKILVPAGTIEERAYKTMMRDGASSLSSWSAFMFCEIVRSCCDYDKINDLIEKYSEQAAGFMTPARQWPDDIVIEKDLK